MIFARSIKSYFPGSIIRLSCISAFVRLLETAVRVSHEVKAVRLNLKECEQNLLKRLYQEGLFIMKLEGCVEHCTKICLCLLIDVLIW